MQFLGLSSSAKPDRKIKTLVWLLRILLGAVFIYSGFVKAVDPWGGQYKIADYFNAWGSPMSDGINLMAGCLLSGAEFLMGVMLITGSFRRLTAIAALIFMSFMTGLTLYIWIADPVKDCGCFGEALILSNAATFWKNVVLWILTFALFLYNGKVRPLIHHRFQWLGLVFSAAFVIAVQFIGYNIQPLIDFRPYPVGSDFANATKEAGDEGDMKFVYEKDGVRQTFSLDDLPGDDWTFVERIEPDGKADTEATFAIFDGEEDVTSEVIANEGRQFILTVTNPLEHKLARSEMANRLKAYADSTGASMIALVALSPDRLEPWSEYTGADYDVFTAEDTDLKMLVRGEAGLVMLDDGVIKWKFNLSSIDPYFPSDENGVDGLHPIEKSGLLSRLCVTWLLLMFATCLLSRYYRHWFKIREQKRLKKAENTPETDPKPENPQN